MATNVDPIIGSWYHRVDKDQEFEVVAFDEEEGVVEIQHSDGNLELIDINSWYTLELEDIESPGEYAEDSSDENDLDELDYDEADMDEEDWDES